jgi:hypothetical protein
MNSFKLDPNWRKEKDEFVRALPVAGCLAAMILAAIFMAGCFFAAGCDGPRKQILPDFAEGCEFPAEIPLEIILRGTEFGRHGGTSQEWSIRVQNREDRWVSVQIGAKFQTDAGETIEAGNVSVTLSPKETRVIECAKIIPKQEFTAITGAPFLVSKQYAKTP